MRKYFAREKTVKFIQDNIRMIGKEVYYFSPTSYDNIKKDIVVGFWYDRFCLHEADWHIPVDYIFSSRSKAVRAAIIAYDKDMKRERKGFIEGFKIIERGKRTEAKHDKEEQASSG